MFSNHILIKWWVEAFTTFLNLNTKYIRLQAKKLLLKIKRQLFSLFFASQSISFFTLLGRLINKAACTSKWSACCFQPRKPAIFGGGIRYYKTNAVWATHFSLITVLKAVIKRSCNGPDQIPNKIQTSNTNCHINDPIYKWINAKAQIVGNI